MPYYVNPANLDLGAAEAEAAIRAGADAWAAQSHANFELTYAGTTSGTNLANNAKNEVFFRNSSSGSAIATTYTWYSGDKIVDSDIVFWDGAYRFFAGNSGCSGGFYIEDIALHEFGHAFGLEHSNDSSASMYYGVGYCSQEIRTLASDDIAGIEAIYPAAATTPPADPTNLLVAMNNSNPSSALDLSWADTATSEERFNVERSQDGVSWMLAGSVGANITNFVDSGLQPSTTYYHRVRAENSAGYSGYAGPVSATTQQQTPTPPGTPTSPSPANGATGVNVDADLAWTASGATRYDVYWGTAPNPPLYRADVSTNKLALPTMPAGTKHYWKIVARNDDGTAMGSEWSFTTKVARTKGKK
jgi:hypothetical protein